MENFLSTDERKCMANDEIADIIYKFTLPN